MIKANRCHCLLFCVQKHKNGTVHAFCCEGFGKDMKQQEEIFWVRMLGDFVFRRGDEPIRLERTSNTKALQALQVLLYQGEDGASRDMLREVLYESDPVADPGNNLKVTISNLRSRLRKAALEDIISIEYRDGRYYFRSRLPVRLDVRDFERALQAGRAGDTSQLLWAESLYKGEFLPALSGAGWASVVAARCREEYFECVRQLAERLSRARQWEKLLPIATRAAQRYCTEEWQYLRLDCLVSLQRYDEAKQVFEQAAVVLAEKFGVRPSERMVQRLRQVQPLAALQEESLDQVAVRLEEKQAASGAYRCSYPSFIDVYRICSRMLERSGQSAYMAMCWLVDARGDLLQDSGKITAAAQKLDAAIGRSLRRGDTYTQYGRDRFLLLLVGTNREDCETVCGRILEQYRQNPERGVSFLHSVVMVGESALEMLQHSGWQPNS